MAMQNLFDQWMNEVNDLMFQSLGLTTGELPDMDYFEMFMNFTAPDTAVARMRYQKLGLARAEDLDFDWQGEAEGVSDTY